MQQPLQISFHNLDHSDAAEHHVRTQVEKLLHFEPRLLGCRVTLERPHRHRHLPAPRVCVTLTVPGEELVIDYTPAPEHAEEDFRAAIDQAFARAKSRLVRHAGRERGERVRRGRGAPSAQG
jgi:putative sigma-54 modulation protein